MFKTKEQKYFFALLVMMKLCFLGISQDDRQSLGARGTGMGQTSVSIVDEYGLFNNIGAIGKLKDSKSFVSYQSRYGISDLQSFGLGVTHHTQLANFGMGFYRFGGVYIINNLYV